MNKIEIVHLHVHSDYSILDGYATVDEIIQSAKRIGSRAIAITDHGNLHALAEFYIKAKEAEIKPIIGCEFYYLHTDQFERIRDNYHLLVLAYNETGLKNLIKLSSLSYEIGFYYKPRINKKLLENYKDGLICTTGCIESVIPSLIRRDNLDEAEKTLRYFYDLFGENFYIELQDHGLKAQEKVNKVLIEWHKKYDIPIIATNDSHYATHDQSIAHDIMLAIQTKTTINDPKRLRFSNDNNQLLSEFYIKSPNEMMAKSIFKEYPDSITNTVSIAEKCNIDLSYGKLIVPEIQAGSLSVVNFREHVIELAKMKFGVSYTQDIENRLFYELDIIERLGFVPYFVLVKKVIDLARENGISVGPGRGSVGGSLVAYVLGITRINPLKHGLLFERFLNPDRVSPPDIDIDFEDSERERLIEIISNYFGSHNVAHIATFGRIGARMALRDIARVFDVKKEDIDRFIDMFVPTKPGITFEDIENSISENEKSDIFNLHLVKQASREVTYQNIYDYSKMLFGRVRHTGMHASGIIITNQPVDQLFPIFTVKEENKEKRVVQFEYEYVEKLGGLKVDILGLSTLSIVKRVLRKLQEDGINIDLDSLTPNDPKVYALFSRGHTCGIFQFESQGMKSYLRQLKPDRIEDIIAMNALYRPGPLENIPLYIDRKHGKQTIEYIDPRLEPILKETYGIIVYQEQIMEIAKVIANYKLSEADLLRRAIGKKKREILEENKAIFIKRATENNTPKEIAEKIFSDIEKFADYGFNKSHAAAYAYLAYQTAYLKTYYPEVYLSEVINVYKDDKDYIRDILYECEETGIRVKLPSIYSKFDTQVENNNIILGLSVIRDIGWGGYQEIQKAINQLKKQIDCYKIKSMLNKRVYEALIKSGVMDEYTNNRTEALNSINIGNTLFDFDSIQTNQNVSANKPNDKIDEISNEIQYSSRILSDKYRLPFTVTMNGKPTILSYKYYNTFFSEEPALKYIITTAIPLEIKPYETKSASNLHNHKNKNKEKNNYWVTLADNFGIYKLKANHDVVQDVERLMYNNALLAVSNEGYIMRIDTLDKIVRIKNGRFRFIFYADEVKDNIINTFSDMITENSEEGLPFVVSIIDNMSANRDMVNILAGCYIKLNVEKMKQYNTYFDFLNNYKNEII